MGQQRASGKTSNVTVNIESYSTLEDQKVLFDAFTSGDHDALAKTSEHGEIEGESRDHWDAGVTRSLIYALLPPKNGRRICLITDRSIHFTEAYANGRTKDYDLSALEINLNTDPKQSDGSLIVAGEFGISEYHGTELN